MKRKLVSKPLKQGLLAVPAAALMLGAAQAGTTIGLNFQSWYYDSGTTPQTIGYGQGYQTTGWPVTAKAFGLLPARWVNTDPLDCSSAVATSITMGSITANLNTVNMWESDIGNLVNPADEWAQGGPLPVSWSTVLPGNDEVTWSFEDNTGWTNSLSGLNTAFPNGYVIQLIGVSKCTASSRVIFTTATTSFTNAFDTIYTAGNANFHGPVGLMATPTLTSDTLTFGAFGRSISSAQSCALAGFIITDQPVVTKDPANTTVNSGATLNLSAGSVVGVGTLSYQWRTNGTPIPGATSATYSKPSVSPSDAGSYDLVVTNLYGATTSAVATVTVVQVPTITKDLTGASGTIFAGANFSAWSVVAGGAQPLHYLWFKGNTPAGTDSPTLTLTGATVGDTGDYHVTVSNTLGTAKSATNHLTVVASPDVYTTDVAQDTPGAYWPLGESSGLVAVDYSGGGNNGNISNNVTLGATGPRPPTYQGFNAGKLAYQFDGGSSFINCGTGPSLSGTTDFTLEAWVNTTATADGVIVQQRYSAGFNGEYKLQVSADGTVSWLVYGGGYQFNMSTPNKVNDGKWHHIAAVRRNGTNGVIYIDGTIAAAQTVAYIAPLDSTFLTYIGADMRDSVAYFNGTISDVAIYPYALSEHRIILHAYNGRLGNAPFSVSTIPGGFVLDTKPVGVLHPGVNQGASWSNSITDTASTPVTRTGVALFTGTSQISAAANPDFDSPNGTICFWLQATAPITGPGAEAAMLFDRRTTNGTVITMDVGGAIAWQGPGTSRNEIHTGYVPDGNWHHIAVTFGQTTSDSISIYIDGALSGSVPVTNAWAWDTTQEIEIGRSHDAYWYRLNGQMDDFRIYNRVLTPAEIASIQASNALVDTAALKVRYNFDTTGGGLSLTWPVGALYSSPTLGPTAVWTPVAGAVSPYPIVPPAPSSPAGAALFYRAGF
jgi:hypothetical protein